MAESEREIPIDYKTSYEEAREELSNALTQTEECQMIMLHQNEQLKQKQNEVKNLQVQLQQLMEENINYLELLETLQTKENEYKTITQTQTEQINQIQGLILLVIQIKI